MKTAKEMFEELGLKCEEHSYMILYETEGYTNETYVAFLTKNKEIEMTIKANFKNKKKLNKAIHKQLEELGWLDE